MARSGPLREAARRESILLAIGEHDNGWREPDEAPSADAATGRVLDFITLPLGERQGVWPRGIGRLAGRDRWAAALVAHHAAFVYDRFRSDAAWTRFFSDMEATRAEHVAASGLTLDQLLEDYVHLRLGDLISLAFCTRTSDLLVHDGWSIRLATDRVIVAPDLFDGQDIPFIIEAREIDDVPYRSDRALRDAVHAAKPVTMHGIAGSEPSRG
jgi:hypothetical protein